MSDLKYRSIYIKVFYASSMDTLLCNRIFFFDKSVTMLGLVKRINQSSLVKMAAHQSIEFAILRTSRDLAIFTRHRIERSRVGRFVTAVYPSLFAYLPTIPNEQPSRGSDRFVCYVVHSLVTVRTDFHFLCGSAA